MEVLLPRFQKNVACLSREKAEILLIEVVKLTQNQTTPFFQELLRILYFRVYGTSNDVFIGASTPGIFTPSEKIPGKYTLTLPANQEGHDFIEKKYGLFIIHFKKGTIGITMGATNAIRYRIYLQNENATATYYPPHGHFPFGKMVVDGILETTLIDASSYLIPYPPDYISQTKNGVKIQDNETNIHIDIA